MIFQGPSGLKAKSNSISSRQQPNKQPNSRKYRKAKQIQQQIIAAAFNTKRTQHIYYTHLFVSYDIK